MRGRFAGGQVLVSAGEEAGIACAEVQWDGMTLRQPPISLLCNVLY